MSNEHNNAPAVPQGEPVAWKYELAVRIDADGRGSGWCWHLTDYKPSVPDGMIRNLRPLTYADATPAPAPAQDEPFGHFRVEPFGWTDCAKDDEGAIALYERPQEVGLTDEALDNLIEDLSEWSRHVVEDTAHQTLEAHVREVLEKNPIIAALRAKGQS